MEKARKISKRGWAAIIAAALVIAIIFTGTLAWINMNQEVINEIRGEKNPGGRIHDDFNGLANKDIYAENFTDPEDGMPVYVRVMLREYMEIGEEAGINRADPNRQAKPVLAGADINDPSTWHTHIPGQTVEDDPFRDYWTLVTGGKTVYMPTFNKNKDSISPEVNGTYGVYDAAAKDYLAGTPYSDYVEYTDNAADTTKIYEKTAFAYYDADANQDDEYLTDTNPAKVPGGGGVEKTASTPNGNYIKEEETHRAKATLNSLGIISMADWIRDGMPICNKWVYDTDGWFYWPEPIFPQTATGLLLDQVVQAQTPGGKSYYAIDVVGQFADLGSWGTPAEYEKDSDGNDKIGSDGNKIVTKEPTGFYVYGISDDAVDLLNNATQVKVGQDNNWYLPQGQNLYKKIVNDKGDLSDLICAFEDTTIGSSDDCSDIEYVADGVTVNGHSYGKYFLKPTATEAYYRAVGYDGLLGTADDDRLWIPVGNTFPVGAMDKVVSEVKVSPMGGKTEMEVGTTLSFTAEVKLDGAAASSNSVTWSVAPSARARLAPNTKIDANSGVLTVDENETNTSLVVTATSQLDNRVAGQFPVGVYGRVNVQITAEGGVDAVQAGKTLQLDARSYRGTVVAAEQPASFSWSVAPKTRANVDELKISETGLLTVGRNISGSVVVTATYNNGTRDVVGTLELRVNDPQAITVDLTEPADLKMVPGQTLTFSANLSGPVAELGKTDIKWTAGTSSDNGKNITVVPGVTIPDGVLTVANDYSISDYGDVLFVKAAATDSTAKNAYKASRAVTVIRPDSVAVGIDGDTNGNQKVLIGTSLQFTAAVKNADGTPYGDGSSPVKWSVTSSTGAVQTGTSISKTGKLQVASNEPVGSYLTVTATSKVDSRISDSMSLTVDDGKIQIVGDIIEFDGRDFIVLFKDSGHDRQLIMSARLLSNDRVFDDTSGDGATKVTWNDSYLCGYLNNEDPKKGWLGNQTELMAALVDPEDRPPIKTRTDYSKTDVFDSNDNIFLLSEADVFGTIGGTPTTEKDDYTVGAQFKWKSGNWSAYDRDVNVKQQWWLRSPYSANNVATVKSDGKSGNAAPDTISPKIFVRPACWVKISKSPAPKP